MLGSRQTEDKNTNKAILKGDMVNHPEHYNHGIECIDYIESHDLNFNEGNVVKYVTRHKYKNGLEDLKKARFYLDREIAKYGKRVTL